MKLLYQFGIFLYTSAIRCAALFNPKARKWIRGRTALFARLEQQIAKGSDVIWIHCASLGEFEQGRPIIERLKQEFPDYKLLLSFFSPSGYEIRKDYALADYVFYVPSDTPKHAKKWLETVEPKLAIFVKYEFWYFYLQALKQQNIPTILVSAVFHPQQPFFKGWSKSFFRSMLNCFTQLFVQNQSSADLLQSIGVQNYVISGDSRIDRVLNIAAQNKDFPIVKAFCEDQPTLICGSTWEADEKILTQFINQNQSSEWKYLIAPHDISEIHIQKLEKLINVPHTRYTTLLATPEASVQVLILDTIGMLSQIYQYGKVAYIGGGFGAGIHNTLEPAAHGLPVIFGPKYHKFEEAVQLIRRGGGFSITSPEEFTAVFEELEAYNHYSRASQMTINYLQESKGSTDVILDYIKTIL